MKNCIKWASLLFLLVAVVSCSSDDETYTIDDWVGNWRITNEQEKSLSTKASVGSISIDKSRPDNGLTISAQLFHLGNVNIPATLSGNRVTFSVGNVSGVSLSGNGEMVSSNKIEFTWIIDDGADRITYIGTATK